MCSPLGDPTGRPPSGRYCGTLRDRLAFFSGVHGGLLWARAPIGCPLGGESVKISLADGNLLSLRTGDFALSPFTIDFGDASSTEAAGPQEQLAAEASGAQVSGEVAPEFKEMMDSREAFMDQYCDFMAKYTDATSSGDSAALLAMTADYASLVQQELDWAGKMDGVDESALSPADDAYYLEVQGRVLKKLGETGVSPS